MILPFSLLKPLQFAGAIDNSLLVISLCVGFSLDAVIAKRIGARGYGVLIGASIGNCISDGIAALPEP